ncbi:hypothetical protein A1O1_07541 [Capronia coronata CBS 617.96]|uniref:Uncharacterized protein n=1 Tax=Capronia coronata CBS 617.96 TaxID=1182541 RepID=W9XTP8_9EURO|nr:uncharacterized protein A1O1_07541 [Capronia coronata CBS 617.96]EXJ83912.1 hypothetical protein A1O1_07541 [Capronia coronata CBS 617.96]
MPEAGRNSGGDLFDMAKDGTTIPADAAEPRYIPSKPRPDQIASAADPNNLGGRTLAEAADNAGDIPRTTRDTDVNDILTGTGDSLGANVASKRLHAVPGGVVRDPQAKGSTRTDEYSKTASDFDRGASDGPGVDRAPGQEGLSDEQVMDQIERKEV